MNFSSLAKAFKQKKTNLQGFTSQHHGSQHTLFSVISNPLLQEFSIGRRSFLTATSRTANLLVMDSKTPITQKMIINLLRYSSETVSTWTMHVLHMDIQLVILFWIFPQLFRFFKHMCQLSLHGDCFIFVVFFLYHLQVSLIQV